jgi:hypothetical protein
MAKAGDFLVKTGSLGAVAASAFFACFAAAGTFFPFDDCAESVCPQANIHAATQKNNHNRNRIINIWKKNLKKCFLTKREESPIKIQKSYRYRASNITNSRPYIPRTLSSTCYDLRQEVQGFSCKYCEKNM